MQPLATNSTGYNSLGVYVTIGIIHFNFYSFSLTTGNSPAKGIQGMRYTREVVREMVSQAQNMKSNEILPQIKFEVTKDGANFLYDDQNNDTGKVTFNSEKISYCVQDLTYSRVFSMITVSEDVCTCYSFLCESSKQAQKVTCALSAALQHCGEKLKGGKTRIVIDLKPDRPRGSGGQEEEEGDEIDV